MELTFIMLSHSRCSAAVNDDVCRLYQSCAEILLAGASVVDDASLLPIDNDNDDEEDAVDIVWMCSGEVDGVVGVCIAATTVASVGACSLISNKISSNETFSSRFVDDNNVVSFLSISWISSLSLSLLLRGCVAFLLEDLPIFAGATTGALFGDDFIVPSATFAGLPLLSIDDFLFVSFFDENTDDEGDDDDEANDG
jgi:hypothetical protein